MPQQLFVFVQLEFPWKLGPADGRYLLRREDDGEPEHVVVLGTLEAGGRPIGAPAAAGRGGVCAAAAPARASHASSPPDRSPHRCPPPA